MAWLRRNLRRKEELRARHDTDGVVQGRMQNWQEFVHVVKVDVEKLLHLLPTE